MRQSHVGDDGCYLGALLLAGCCKFGDLVTSSGRVQADKSCFVDSARVGVALRIGSFRVYTYTTCFDCRGLNVGGSMLIIRYMVVESPGW